MTKYIVTNGTHTICARYAGTDHSELTIEADSKCNLPTVEFSDYATAQAANYSLNGDSWDSPLTVQPVECVEEVAA